MCITLCQLFNVPPEIVVCIQRDMNIIYLKNYQKYIEFHVPTEYYI